MRAFQAALTATPPPSAIGTQANTLDSNNAKQTALSDILPPQNLGTGFLQRLTLTVDSQLVSPIFFTCLTVSSLFLQIPNTLSVSHWH